MEGTMEGSRVVVGTANGSGQSTIILGMNTVSMAMATTSMNTLVTENTETSTVSVDTDIYSDVSRDDNIIQYFQTLVSEAPSEILASTFDYNDITAYTTNSYVRSFTYYFTYSGGEWIVNPVVLHSLVDSCATGTYSTSVCSESSETTGTGDISETGESEQSSSDRLETSSSQTSSSKSSSTQESSSSNSGNRLFPKWIILSLL